VEKKPEGGVVVKQNVGTYKAMVLVCISNS
jgi:hypothetical protein